MPVYGLAEASLGVTLTAVVRAGRRWTAWSGRRLRRKDARCRRQPSDENAIAFVSSGLPLPKHEVMIVDEDGKRCAERTEGFLWFRGPSATSGYYKNAEATAKLFPRGTAQARRRISVGEFRATGRTRRTERFTLPGA